MPAKGMMKSKMKNTLFASAAAAAKPAPPYENELTIVSRMP
jgi:hypothetical protein